MSMFRIDRFDSIVSTNELVKHALDEGCDEGLVCRAAEQVGGYGRQGRSWASPRGGSYQSLLLRPDVSASSLPTLSLVVVLAARQALLAFCSPNCNDIKVKWPNDVVCDQGKLVGISLESHGNGVCVGIGVNVFRPAQQMAVGGKNTPAYLEDLAGKHGASLSVDAVGDKVLSVFERRYGTWRRDGFAPFVDEFNACNVLAGKQVSIADRNGKVVASGLAVGVDENGSLVVGTAPISSGEAHVL